MGLKYNYMCCVSKIYNSWECVWNGQVGTSEKYTPTCK